MNCTQTLAASPYIGIACIVMAGGLAIAAILAVVAWSEYLDDIGAAKRIEALKGQKT